MFEFLKRTPTSAPYEARLPVDTFDVYLDNKSPTWRYVEKWANEQLVASRIENDYQKHGELRTAALRGKIALLKQLIALPLGGTKNGREDDDGE